MKKVSSLFALCFVFVYSLAQAVGVVPVTIKDGRLVPAKAGYELVSYNFSLVVKNGGDMKGPYHVNEPGIRDPDAVKCLEHMKPGDKIIFDKVVLKEKTTNKFVKGTDVSTIL